MRIVANVDCKGGLNCCSLYCMRVHRVPLNIDAERHKRNPIVLNSTSPNTVNTSPIQMSATTSTNIHVMRSIPNIYAEHTTNIGAEDFTIV